jgi:hypothetical protein
MSAFSAGATSCYHLSHIKIANTPLDIQNQMMEPIHSILRDDGAKSAIHGGPLMLV